MVESTDRNGGRLTLTYNMYQSTTSRRSENGDISESFGYYPDGKLRYAIGGGMRFDYAYDVMGRISGKSAGGKSLITYTHDVDGNRTGLTDLTGKRTEYEYDFADRLRNVFDNGKRQAHYTYNPDGTIDTMEIGDSGREGVLYTEYSYDRDKNLTGLKTLVRQGALTGRYGLLTDNHYSYDRAGNCVIKQTLSGETRYSYDSLYQLTEASYPNKKEQFTYDRAGNRLTRTVAREHGEAVREAYTYDNANRLTKRSIYNMTAGAQEIPETPEMADRMYRYIYDRQGNMLSDGDNTYQYDGMNRLKEINTKAGDIQKNHYDGEGLRAELEENGKLVSFLYSDGEAVLEDSETAGITRYIRGLGLLTSDSESARTYYHYASDDLGSITHITDEEGNVLNRYEYDAFGNFTVKEETIPNRFAFTGEQYDPITSQYYLRARFYNPVIGRFLNEDTYYGDGLNLYAYCHNNPVEYVDPSGNWCKKKYDRKVREYRKKGYSKEDARIMANYEAIRESRGVEAAEKYLQNQLNISNSNNNRPIVVNDGLFNGRDTYATLVTDDGRTIYLSSGNGDPRYTNYANNGHVEQKAALYMRENNIQDATLYHNNTNGTCGWCNNMTPTFLQEGSTLKVVPPANAVANNSRAVADPKIYVGNGSDPKTSKSYNKK